jgi:hypothetical protein
MKYFSNHVLSLVLVSLTRSQVSGFNLSPHGEITHNISSKNSKKQSKLCMSVPNDIDTATSGFASIARLPFGTTVSSPADEKLPYRIKALYDIEQSLDCRQVRERLTELDLAVETVIPAASNSRALNDKKYKFFLEGGSNISGKDIPTMIVADDDTEEEKTLVGVESIMNFLDTTYGSRGSVVDDVDDLKTKAAEILIAIGAYIPPIVRFGRGGAVATCAVSASTPRPEKPLVSKLRMKRKTKQKGKYSFILFSTSYFFYLSLFL